ncbi:hypothetical protein [Corynebacterium kalidii]
MTEQPSLFDLRVAIGDLDVGDAFSHSGWDHSVVTARTAESVTFETTDTVNGRRVGESMTRALDRVVERR